jgi:capsid protein
MAGVGAFRLFSAATRGVLRVPTSLEKGAECLDRVVLAVETQNAVSDQVMELKGLLMTTREEIMKMGNEREQIGRELRLMSRKIEGFSCYAQDELK